MLASVSAVGSGRVKPSVNLRPTAQPISNSPAKNRCTHAIAVPVAGSSLPDTESEIVLARAQVGGSAGRGKRTRRKGPMRLRPGHAGPRQPHASDKRDPDRAGDREEHHRLAVRL